MKNTILACKDAKTRKNIVIGVDGGVNLKTINRIYKTGIDVTVVGSGLYGSDDIIKRFKDLENY